MPTFTAGQYASASDLNANITGHTRAVGSVTSATVTTSAADLSGCTVTFSTAVANTLVLVVGTFDFQINGTTDIAGGTLVVDGTTVSGEQAILNGTVRATVAMTWRVTLAAAGSHTLKLQVGKTGSSNTVTVRAAGSSISVVGNGVT